MDLIVEAGRSEIIWTFGARVQLTYLNFKPVWWQHKILYKHLLLLGSLYIFYSFKTN